MSSHHFVKEGQEPALVILDALSLELAGPLLEWAPLVMVADTALRSVLTWGIKVDVVLSHTDPTEEVKEELKNQFPIEIISYQDQADLLDKAFVFLIRKNQMAVNFMALSSDSLFKTASRYADKIQIDLIDRSMHWLCIYSKQYEKWLPENSQLYIRMDEGQNLQCSGLRSQSGYWTTEKDGIIAVHSDSTFWVGELL